VSVSSTTPYAEDLDQLITVAVDAGQRRIVPLDEPDAAAEAALGEATYVFEHQIDVDRSPLDRPGVRELLHVIHQVADTVGLVADQADQWTLVVRDARLEQLRSTANTGQGVLDLMRQSHREAGHRAGAAAMNQLAIEPVRDRARVQHHQDAAWQLGQRRHVQIDQPWRPAVERQVDAVVGHAVPCLLHPSDKIEQRAVHRQQVVELAPHEHAATGAEQLFRRGIDEPDPQRPVGHQHATRHGVENDLIVGHAEARFRFD
jgi:hypothetical protein